MKGGVIAKAIDSEKRQASGVHHIVILFVRVIFRMIKDRKIR